MSNLRLVAGLALLLAFTSNALAGDHSKFDAILRDVPRVAGPDEVIAQIERGVARHQRGCPQADDRCLMVVRREGAASFFARRAASTVTQCTTCT